MHDSQSPSAPEEGPEAGVALVVSDVDGTLVDGGKRLNDRTLAAARTLRGAGVALAVCSARPPRGLRHIAEPLGLTTPIGDFNGGRIVTPGFEPLAGHPLAPETALEAIEALRGRGVDAWIFDGNEWLVTTPDGPHVDRERATLRFEPRVVERLEDHLSDVGKIVGVSDDAPRLAEAEAALRAPGGATVARSQAHHLDVTHARADKGAVVRLPRERLGVARGRVMVLGDGHNDLAMFAEAGPSVAMGQAPREVREAASAVTAANDAEGFAEAIVSDGVSPP